jgi:hypothetical protein
MNDTATTDTTTATTCNNPDGTPHACAGAACDHTGCHAGWFARNPRPDGLVYCCLLHGWLTPADAYEASQDSYG